MSAHGTPHRPARAFLALLAGTLLAPAAHAALFGLTCTASATAVTFGTYSPLAPTPLKSTGTVTVSCSAIFPGTAPVTVQLGPGASGSFAARHLVSGAGVLGYNLYLDAAASQIWGDGTGGSLTGSLNVAITNFFGAGKSSATIYGLMPALQDVAPGSYSDTITVTINY